MGALPSVEGINISSKDINAWKGVKGVSKSLGGVEEIYKNK